MVPLVKVRKHFTFAGGGWGGSAGRKILSASQLAPSKLFQRKGVGGGGEGMRLFWGFAIKQRNIVFSIDVPLFLCVSGRR